MSKSLNKKILCFIDEYGTAGQGPLYFGAVFSFSHTNGKLDKCFSDHLEENANEIHASNMNDDYLKDLMSKFWRKSPSKTFILMNYKVNTRGGSAPILYANGMIEAVKVGLKLFRNEILKKENINNVEVITDINDQNTHDDFKNVISEAKSSDGLFQAVRHVQTIDSAASRMLQLADITAYSRKFITAKELNARQLREMSGIITK